MNLTLFETSILTLVIDLKISRYDHPGFLLGPECGVFYFYFYCFLKREGERGRER